MLEQITEAVVLRTLAYGESDKIVTFATRDFGRLSGIAKGAKRSRRRFPNALETFCHIRLYFRPSRTGGLALVLRCDLIDSHSGIAMDLKALALASFFAEIVDSTLQEGQEAIRVFSLLEWALRWLESRGSSLEILPYFELQWLGATGLQPELRFCLRCRSEMESYDGARFSVPLGGIVCHACSSEPERFSADEGGYRGRPLPIAQPGTIRSLVALQRAKEDGFLRIHLSLEQGREAHRILKSFLRFHLGKELRSGSFLEETLSL